MRRLPFRTLLVLLAAPMSCSQGFLARTPNSPQTFDSAPSEPHIVAHPRGTCDLCDLYHEAQRYVVRVRTARGAAAGLVVSSLGEVLTNAHVVEGDERPIVETYSGDSFGTGVVKADRHLDLALLRVEGPAATWVPFPIHRNAMPEVGSDVYVIGHPLGLGWTVTRGVVSASRRAGEVSERAMIQTDASISPGNSGGPLLDREGNLVGLVVFKISGGGAENIAFAIPASEIVEFLKPPVPGAGSAGN